jgi:predicted nucleotidyltransferase
MSDTSKTYKELASPHFGEVFSLIENVCKDQNIPVYLIGAHAKIILMLKKGILPARGTKDIDFAKNIMQAGS